MGMEIVEHGQTVDDMPLCTHSTRKGDPPLRC